MEVLEAALEYASVSDQRHFQKFSVQLACVNRYFRTHPKCMSVVDKCAKATADLIHATTKSSAIDALRRGANPNAPGALHNACRRGFGSVVLDHEEFADVDVLDLEGRTALEVACEEDNYESIELLLESAADVNVICMGCGCSVLFHAVRDYRPRTMMLLLSYGADVGLPGTGGNTPLHVVVDADDLDTAEILLSASKRSSKPMNLNAKNDDGKSLLCLAVGSDDMVDMLLDEGAVPDMGALQCAAEHGELTSFDLMMDRVEGSVDVDSLVARARAFGHGVVADQMMEWAD